MSDKVYEIPAEWKRRAYVDDAKYREMYARSIQDPDAFWGEMGFAVIQGYGLTETAPIVTLNHPFGTKRGSVMNSWRDAAGL